MTKHSDASTSLSSSRRRKAVVAALAFVGVVNLGFATNLIEHLRPRLRHSEELLADDPSRCVTLDKYHVEEQFLQKDECFTRQQIIHAIRDLVFTIDTIFRGHNLTYFVDSGTLLGAYRESGVIQHDTDADIGIPLATYEYLRDYPVEFPAHYQLMLWNSTLYPDSTRDDRLPGRLIDTRSGLYLDIFVYLDWSQERTGLDMVGPLPSWCFGNCRNCRKYHDGRQVMVPRYWVYPVVDCAFEGKLVKCPGHTRHFLRYMFGDSFMTPMKDH